MVETGTKQVSMGSRSPVFQRAMKALDWPLGAGAGTAPKTSDIPGPQVAHKGIAPSLTVD